MLSYVRLAAGASVIVLVAFAYLYGRHEGMALCEAANVKRQAAVAQSISRDISSAQDSDLKNAARADKRTVAVRRIYREVPKIIDRPANRNVCLDFDGMLAINQAVAAANGLPDSASGPNDSSAPVLKARNDIKDGREGG